MEKIQGGRFSILLKLARSLSRSRSRSYACVHTMCLLLISVSYAHRLKSWTVNTGSNFGEFCEGCWEGKVEIPVG